MMEKQLELNFPLHILDMIFKLRRAAENSFFNKTLNSISHGRMDFKNSKEFLWVNE